jgi:hypothetical protein
VVLDATTRDLIPRKRDEGSMGQQPQDSLEKKVEEWLKREGWPFEVRVGREFAKRGWKVRHGEYYRDAKGGGAREIDLIATVGHRGRDYPLNLEVVVECKTSRDKPWVGFTSAAFAQDPYRSGLVEVDAGDPSWREHFFKAQLRWRGPKIERDLLDTTPEPLDFDPPGGEDWARWIDAWCGVTLVNATMRSCHSVVQAFRESKGIDAAYASLQQVENAAQVLATSASRTWRELIEHGVSDAEASIFMPVVIVSGKLFVGELDAQDVLSLKETDHLHVRTESGVVLVLDESAASTFAQTAYQLSKDALTLTSFVGDGGSEA